jgi:two-component system nitrate/nitrite response regulator NarL
LSVSDSESSFLVLIVDRDEMSSDLLATRLSREGDIQASSVQSSDLLGRLEDGKVQMVVIGADINHNTKTGFDLANAVRRAHPAVPIVVLLNHSTYDAVVNAFRCGARGIFSRKQPVTELLECVEHVRKGLIWAGAREAAFLLDAFSSLPSPDMSVVNDNSPLTMRELQVVKCAARGKTNKVIACELGLSEHTVKNYLCRAFEKLGVSNRVELLFCLTQRGHALGEGSPECIELSEATD